MWLLNCNKKSIWENPLKQFPLPKLLSLQICLMTSPLNHRSVDNDQREHNFPSIYLFNLILIGELVFPIFCKSDFNMQFNLFCFIFEWFLVGEQFGR